MTEIKLFNRWDATVTISDISLQNKICLTPVIIPHNFGIHSSKGQRHKINVVERLANKLMRSGQGSRKLSGHYIRSKKACGMKLMTMRHIYDAFEIIEQKTKTNPIQILVEALQNAGPREDITRVKRGGATMQVAVDVAPGMRINESLKNIALGTLTATFKKKKSIAACLANEIMLAAKEDNQSYAIKRRDETERIARAARH